MDYSGDKIVYQPAEDSIFLSEVIKEKVNEKNIKALDMGIGSGIQSKTLLEIGIKKENITAVDINPEAIIQVSKLKVKTRKSDLFKKIKEKFDLIIFNPPYLPESEYDSEPDTTGGKKGDEIILRFIRELKKHLNKDGKCFLLTSSLTPNTEWRELAKTKELRVRKLATKKIFFEELYVWEIS